MLATQKSLTKLVAAQSVSEKIALARAAQILSQLEEHDARMNSAQRAIEGDSQHVLFTDMYIRHVDQLVKQRVRLVSDLEEANAKVRIEKVRSKTLQLRLKTSVIQFNRKAEEAALLERIDRC